MSGYELTQVTEGGGLKPSGSVNSLNEMDSNDVDFRGINFSVPGVAKPDANPKLPVPRKRILSDCWGSVKSGQVCAILGPSGAGKSSLMNVLAGRSASVTLQGVEVTGEVRIGGNIVNPVAFRKNIAYVMQDDSLMATATPREALEFSAHLRLPPGTTEEDIKGRVETLLTGLGLDGCADVMIGGEMIKGISGGQRKRTSVGVELITNPKLLFLDEPTSGLDSFNAYNLVKLLKKVASNNTAVMCTIHQPSSEVFFLFDKCIFMRNGKVFYQGPVTSIVDYYDEKGYPVEQQHNPSDHIMALTQTISEEDCAAKNLYMLPDTDHKALTLKNDGEDAVNFENPITAGTFVQLYYLSLRESRNIKRDVGALIGRFGVTIFLNLLFGLIWLDAGNQDDGDRTNFQAHFGAVTMVTISSMFGSAQPVMLLFPFERPMFLREYSTGTYSATSYFIVKTLLDLPLTLLQTLCQWILVYFLVDLQGNFFYMVLASWGLGCASASCGMALGCLVSNVKDVTELAPLLFVPQLLFAGFFIQTSEIPVFLRWAQYLCGIKYAMNIILSTEFSTSNENCRDSAAALSNCESVITDNDIDLNMMWFYILMLIVLFAGFRLIALMTLVQKSRRFY